MKARKDDLTGLVSTLTLDDSEKSPAERVNIFFKFVEVSYCDMYSSYECTVMCEWAWCVACGLTWRRGLINTYNDISIHYFR